MKTAIIITASVFAALVLFFAIFLFLIKPGGRKEITERYRGQRFAHRGLHGGGVAENSMTAFRAARDAGYGIELDVRLSSDGELVVFHDDTLQRVCGIAGRVDGFSVKELSKISLSGTCDTVPRFSEVLEAIDGTVPLLVEIKEDAGSLCVTEKCAAMLKEYKGDFIVESFNPLALARFGALMPDVPRGFLSQNFMRQKKYRKPLYFLLQNMLLNVVCRPDFIAYCHTDFKNAALRLVRKLFSVPVFAWTVRTEREERAAYENGFFGVIFEGYTPDGADAPKN